MLIAITFLFAAPAGRERERRSISYLSTLGGGERFNKSFLVSDSETLRLSSRHR